MQSVVFERAKVSKTGSANNSFCVKAENLRRTSTE